MFSLLGRTVMVTNNFHKKRNSNNRQNYNKEEYHRETVNPNLPILVRETFTEGETFQAFQLRPEDLISGKISSCRKLKTEQRVIYNFSHSLQRLYK